MDEVLKAVAGVNWRTLGKWLIGEEIEPQIIRYTNLDRIRDKYKSDEARLRAVVEKFVAKTDRSWRRVVCALLYAKEIGRAQQISSYAEPPQGMYCVVLLTTYRTRSNYSNILIARTASLSSLFPS